MSIPKYTDYFPFVLKYADVERTADEYLELIMKDMGVSSSDQQIKNSGGEPTVRNRLRWAIHYLRHAKCMEKPSRGKYVITDRGKDLRKNNGMNISSADLKKFEEFTDFINNTTDSNVKEKTTTENLTPIENIEKNSNQLKEELIIELRKKIFELSPYFFEKLVVDLVNKMGYGKAEITGKSSDGGIDGIVYLDTLGVDKAYIQAKRFENNKIGRPELQKFVVALHGEKSEKGIFITTSDFGPNAKDYVKSVSHKIIMINGKELFDLMIRYGVGLEITHTFNCYKINDDYFSDE